jgi:hypothetical protein
MKENISTNDNFLMIWQNAIRKIEENKNYETLTEYYSDNEHLFV